MIAVSIDLQSIVTLIGVSTVPLSTGSVIADVASDGRRTESGVGDLTESVVGRLHERGVGSNASHVCQIGSDSALIESDEESDPRQYAMHQNDDRPYRRLCGPVQRSP